MAREAIKLGFEKHGSGWRYIKSYRKQRWWSETYEVLTRENKREAWQSFIAFRDGIDKLPAKPVSKNDPLAMIRNVVAEKLTIFKEHAELTANHDEAEHWRKIIEAVPKMTDAQLKEGMATAGFDFNYVSQDGLQGAFVSSDHAQEKEATVNRLKDIYDPELNCKKLVDAYVLNLDRKYKRGKGSYGHYSQVKAALELFARFFGESKSLEMMTKTTIADYKTFLENKIDAKELSANSANIYQKRLRTFVNDSRDAGNEVPLPANLMSKKWIIVTERIEANPFNKDEIKLLLNNGVDKTKLFLLLMLNCSFYQSDISDLIATEVDWKHGRIIKPRTKLKNKAISTGSKDEPFKHNWKLWPQTWELFKTTANKDGVCFITEHGKRLVERRRDNVSARFDNLVTKLKNLNLLPKDWNKTLKQFRKTGADTLFHSEQFGKVAEQYLSHSLAKQSYFESGKVNPSFDAAIDWLGKELLKS